MQISKTKLKQFSFTVRDDSNIHSRFNDGDIQVRITGLIFKYLITNFLFL